MQVTAVLNDAARGRFIACARVTMTVTQDNTTGGAHADVQVAENFYSEACTMISGDVRPRVTRPVAGRA